MFTDSPRPALSIRTGTDFGGELEKLFAEDPPGLPIREFVSDYSDRLFEIGELAEIARGFVTSTGLADNLGPSSRLHRHTPERAVMGAMVEPKLALRLRALYAEMIRKQAEERLERSSYLDARHN